MKITTLSVLLTMISVCTAAPVIEDCVDYQPKAFASIGYALGVAFAYMFGSGTGCKIVSPYYVPNK